MGVFVSLSLLLVFMLGGCSSMAPKAPISNKISSKSETSAKKEIKAFREYEKYQKDSVPSIILPPVYKKISIFDNKKITLSAKDVKLSDVLHSISKLSSLNLVIDHDVPSSMPITLSVNRADLKTVLDIIMDISGCYYEVDGNILHIKFFMRKNFVIPYIHNTTSFKTSLGGDVLNSATSGAGGKSGGGKSGLKGDFSLHYENPKKINDFYTQIENNIKNLISHEGSYTLNKFSGVLSVKDRYKNIKSIEKFVNKVKSRIGKQILIEAKIMEVTLNNEHDLGIDWTGIANSVFETGDKLQLQQNLSLKGVDVAGTMTYTTTNFNALINALDKDGTIDVISNPRIKVLSGQSAIISSGKLVPFWEKEVQITQGTGGSASNTEVTYNRRDVLNGLTLGVTPTVMDDGKIMLNIVPITSDIEDVVKYVDNGVEVASAPVVNVKEFGTIIFARDNDLVLIGGLVSSSSYKDKSQVPVLGDIPFLGKLFQGKYNKSQKRELVILLRLKIVK